MEQQGETQTQHSPSGAFVAEGGERPASTNHPPGGKPRHERKSVDERIADYTKWLMIGTAVLAIATTFLTFATVKLWFYAAEQAHDMKDSIKASQEANDIAREALGSDRAWIGPTNARIIGMVQKGSPITVAVDYRNTGRVPAIRSGYLIDFAKIDSDKLVEHYDSEGFVKYGNDCMSLKGVERGSVTMPTQSDGYTASFQVPGSNIDNNILLGKSVILVRGCMVYNSGGKVSHTTLCFVFQNTVSDPNRIPYCADGNSVD